MRLYFIRHAATIALNRRDIRCFHKKVSDRSRPGLLPGAPAWANSCSPLRRESGQANAVYKPIADFLTKVIGEKVVYKNSDNWLSYQSGDAQGDLRHRVRRAGLRRLAHAKLGHLPLVKLPGNLSFVTVVKSDNTKITELKDLAGRTICGFAPPNLATLTVMYQFDNPSRQPAFLETSSFADAYQGVLSGKCVAGVLQVKMWEELDKEKNATRVVFHSKPVPNQAFTVGPKIAPGMRIELIEALLSEEGKIATRKLRDGFKGQDFVVAQAAEYEDLGVLLRGVWGFELK